MADETATTASGGAQGTPADAGTPAAQAGGADEPLLNKREVVEMRKELRGLKALIEGLQSRPAAAPPAQVATQPDGGNATRTASPTTPAEQGVADRLAAMERELVLSKACAEFGIRPGPVQDQLERLAAYLPRDQIRATAESLVKIQGKVPEAPPATTAAAPPPPAIPAGKIDSGSPGSNPASTIPVNPLQWTEAIMKTMTADERKMRIEAWRATGTSRNPHRGTKRVA
jgi:hypothetical protein